MKLKYYLRGLGMGILFATIVMAIAFSSRLTDKEVENRAREMGMVYSDETVQKLASEETKDSEKKDAEESGETSEKNSTTEETSSKKEEATKETSKATTTEKETKKETESKTTTKAAVKDTKKNTAKETTTTKKETKEETTKKKETAKEETTTKADDTKKTFQISPGMSSNALAEKLAEIGVVDSAKEFNTYLEQNGYAGRLVVGDYSVQGSVSYEKIAKLVTNN